MANLKASLRVLSRLILLAGCPVFAVTLQAAEQLATAQQAETASTVNSAENELQTLRDQLALQQKQIEQLSAALKRQQELIERLAQKSDAGLAASRRTEASTPAPTAASGLGEVASLQPMIPAAHGDSKVTAGSASGGGPTVAVGATIASARAPRPLAGGAQASDQKPSPLSLHIGDADFTIGGFMDFTALFRSTNVGSGIGTTFGSIPFSNSPQGRLTETRFTAQNSRVSLTATSKVGENDVRGYAEADFLGFQPTNGFVTSNSNSLRMRLYWLQLTRGRFEVLAGQSWSMLNPNRVGLSPVPSDVFYSQNMDTNYQVGLTWARQAQFRFIYHPNANWAAGVSLENPQQYVGIGVVLPTTFNPNQVDNGNNVEAPNLHPDIIPKVAYDGKLGERAVHAEAAGLVSSFKVFSAFTNSSSTATGGGGSINVNLELVKSLHLIVNTFYSDGGGRYIFGLGPDLIVKGDGTLSLVHAGSGIGGFEWQINPKSMAYGYYGGAYFRRNLAIEPVNVPIGFGGPLGFSANRSVQEVTAGLIQTFWKNPQYGALQLITQYSYLTRTPWAVLPRAPKDAHLSMGYLDLRYVLP